MSKAFTLATSFVVLLVIWLYLPQYQQIQLMKKQEELTKSFDLLKTCTQAKSAEMQRIEKRIAEVYAPAITGKADETVEYGIGGYSYNSNVTIGKSMALVESSFSALKTTEAKANFIESKLKRIEEYVPHYQDSLAHTPSIRPIPYDSLTAIGSTFGMRFHPILHKLRMHKGVDLAAPQGTPVYAAADGVVEKSSYTRNFGNYVRINHGYGYLTKYGHMSRVIVEEGEIVKKGQVIGYVGNTGLSVHSHLHYEVWQNEQPKNPFYFYLDELSYEEYASLTKKSGRAESFFITK